MANMPEVNAVFGAAPEIAFPSDEAPKGLKAVEIVEGDGPMVRRGDTVTVNYHGVVWGKDTSFDSSFARHQPASFGIGVGQVIRGWDQTVPGHNVGSRLVVSIPPRSPPAPECRPSPRPDRRPPSSRRHRPRLGIPLPLRRSRRCA